MGGVGALHNSGCGGRPLRLNDGFMGDILKWLILFIVGTYVFRGVDR